MLRFEEIKDCESNGKIIEWENLIQNICKTSENHCLQCRQSETDINKQILFLGAKYRAEVKLYCSDSLES